MSAKTAAAHSPAELTYHGISQDLAVFSSASASRPGERNYTFLDTTDHTSHCECKAAETGRACWHLDHLLTAYAMTQVAGFVGLLGDAELLATGQRAGLLVATESATITDTAVYWQCKREFCKRRKEAAAIVAAWEALSYSDKHIDLHVDDRRGEREYVAAKRTLAAVAA